MGFKNILNNMYKILNRNRLFILYILFATLYLGMQMFQGFSFLDIGIYMSGYQHFGDEPATTYYLGQWLLTYSLSSLFCKLFAIKTFMGIRVMHLMLTIVSHTVIYLYLRQYIRTRHIIAGLTLATLAHFGSYTEINYNDYSIFLLTLSILSAHHGITRGRHIFIFASGALAGFAIMFRIVNLTFVLLPSVIWLMSLRWKFTVCMQRICLAFASGTVLGVALALSLIYAGNMLEVLMLTVKDITAISGGADDCHSLPTIIISAYTLYKGIIQGIAPILVLTTLLILSNIYLRGGKNRIVNVALSILIIVNIYLWEAPANITAGICLAALPIIFLRKDMPAATASLYVLSLFIPLIFPIGSNAGPEFYGKDLCHLSLPIATGIMAESMIKIKEKYRAAMNSSLIISFAMICATMVYTNVKRPMMEDGNRLQCRHAIDSPIAEGILTTKENADLHNRLIHKLRPMVKEGSYMICNFSIPMISLLDCRPYAVFSTLFTTAKMNDRYIDTAYGHTHRLPYLLTDKENMSDKDREVERKLENIASYTTLWTDGRYELKVPTDR